VFLSHKENSTYGIPIFLRVAKISKAKLKPVSVR